VKKGKDVRAITHLRNLNIMKAKKNKKNVILSSPLMGLFRHKETNNLNGT